MSLLIGLTAFALVGAADPAASAAPGPAPLASPTGPAKVSAAKVADDDTLVCVREAETGTRFTTKVCKTKMQWRIMNDDGTRMLDRITRNQNAPLGGRSGAGP